MRGSTISFSNPSFPAYWREAIVQISSVNFGFVSTLRTYGLNSARSSPDSLTPTSVGTIRKPVGRA